MPDRIHLFLRSLYIFYLCLCHTVSAAEQSPVTDNGARNGYAKGDLMPVSCLNRSIETGEHIRDELGNLQYIPFPTCNETGQPLAFPYGTPQTQTCTIPELPDELYHLIEFFVHSDVPLQCRIPTYPLADSNALDSSGKGSDPDMWTPFTIAVQGALQYSHLHLHTNINVLFHTSEDTKSTEPRHLIASTAYSLPNTTDVAPRDGTKVLRNEPLSLTFNVGWVDGVVLPGMVGRPVLGVKDHSVGFSLLSFFAIAASAGVGAMGMLVYERKKSGRSGSLYGNGILGGNIGGGMGTNMNMNGGVVRSTGYGGYGGYTGMGKRD